MQKIKSFFSFQELKMAMILAISFSSFIYLFHFGYESYLLNTIIGLYAFYLLLIQNRKTLLFAGFFIGLFWFYWIGFSFIYYDMAWVVPLNALGFGFIYALIFWIVSWPKFVFYRAGMLFLLSLFEPVDFNWLQPELLFVHSYLGVEKWQYIIILLSLSMFIYFKDKKRYFSLVLILFTLSMPTNQQQNLPLNISIESTNLNQWTKWNRSSQVDIIQMNLDKIDLAIQNKQDLVILPESAFPMFLNKHPIIIRILKQKSKKISIITGSLYLENKKNYNVTYFFQDGKFEIAKKMILVPFGEYIPLPSFLAKIVNKLVFDGAVDYTKADKPTYFKIKGIKFKNAICYEATCHELYEDSPKFLIATSNNAWFLPSIQPSIQRLLMQFYAKKHNTIILHSANGAGTGIIYP